ASRLHLRRARGHRAQRVRERVHAGGRTGRNARRCRSRDRAAGGVSVTSPAGAAAAVDRAAAALGAGLGGLARRIDAVFDLPVGDVPGFPSARVEGHDGRIIAGSLDGVQVLAFAGRSHLYEGHEPAVAALPVRIAYALGARSLFVSNAAGGIRPALRPGDLMIIRDHINLMCRNPLAGPVARQETRFPDMSAPYAAEFVAALRGAAAHARVSVVEGVYA